MSWRDDIKEYFRGVAYVIEATFEERHLLWLTRHHHDIGLGHVNVWEDESMGRAPTIAVVGRGKKARPIQIAIYYATLDGMRVAFWYATSQLVDYELIWKWLNPRIGHIHTLDGRDAQSSAANFHNVLHEIERRNGRCTG